MPEPLRRDLRPHNRRFLPQTSSDRPAVLHARSPRHRRPRGVYCVTGSMEREVSTQEGHALAKELGCEFVEASAKNCINVEKAFYDVVRQLRRQKQSYSGRSDRGGARYSEKHYNSRTNSHRDHDYYDSRHRSSHRSKNKGPRCVIL